MTCVRLRVVRWSVRIGSCPSGWSRVTPRTPGKARRLPSRAGTAGNKVLSCGLPRVRLYPRNTAVLFNQYNQYNIKHAVRHSIHRTTIEHFFLQYRTVILARVRARQSMLPEAWLWGVVLKKGRRREYILPQTAPVMAAVPKAQRD